MPWVTGAHLFQKVAQEVRVRPLQPPAHGCPPVSRLLLGPRASLPGTHVQLEELRAPPCLTGRALRVGGPRAWEKGGPAFSSVGPKCGREGPHAWDAGVGGYDGDKVRKRAYSLRLPARKAAD